MNLSGFHWKLYIYLIFVRTKLACRYKLPQYVTGYMNIMFAIIIAYKLFESKWSSKQGSKTRTLKKPCFTLFIKFIVKAPFISFSNGHLEISVSASRHQHCHWHRHLHRHWEYFIFVLRNFIGKNWTLMPNTPRYFT